MLRVLAVLAMLGLSIAGCTNSPESPPALESVKPTTSALPSGPGSALGPAEAQAALDDALEAIDREGSIGFTSQGENVIDDKTTTISGSGAWTRKPLAWMTTTTIDRPKVIINSVSVDVEIIDQIYVESTPSGPYVRTAYPDLKKAGLVGSPWMKGIPAYGVGDGVTKKDITTPPDLRMLLQTEASAGSALGDTLTITGTFPTSSALDALDLTSHVGDLGFTNRFEGSTTRVLVTIGSDGLPRTLQFAGTNIDISKVGLPDYAVEELAGARYFVEYGDAKLKGPIEAPSNSLTP